MSGRLEAVYGRLPVAAAERRRHRLRLRLAPSAPRRALRRVPRRLRRSACARPSWSPRLAGPPPARAARHRLGGAALPRLVPGGRADAGRSRRRCEPADLKRLPVVDKDIVRRAPDSFCPNGDARERSCGPVDQRLDRDAPDGLLRQRRSAPLVRPARRVVRRVRGRDLLAAARHVQRPQGRAGLGLGGAVPPLQPGRAPDLLLAVPPRAGDGRALRRGDEPPPARVADRLCRGDRRTRAAWRSSRASRCRRCTP